MTRSQSECLYGPHFSFDVSQNRRNPSETHCLEERKLKIIRGYSIKIRPSSFGISVHPMCPSARQKKEMDEQFFCISLRIKQQIFWGRGNTTGNCRGGLEAITQPLKIKPLIWCHFHIWFIIQRQSAYDPVHWLHTEQMTAVASVKFALSRGRGVGVIDRQRLGPHFKWIWITGNVHAWGSLQSS